MSLPPGILSNNPGNIRVASDPWQGQAPSLRPGFVAFVDPLHGLRAVMKSLLTYQSAYNLHSVRSIINRWAPPIENYTDAYIADCCGRIGIGQDDFLNLSIPENLIAMTKAIVHHENGKCPDPTLPDWYDEKIYDEAAAMVLPQNTERTTS